MIFDQTFVNTRAQTRRPWTVAVSVVLQTALVATMLIVPLLRIPKLDLPTKPDLRLPVEMVDLRPKPQPVRQQTQTHSITTPRVFQEPRFVVPTKVPTNIVTQDAPEFVSSGGPAGLSTGSALLPGLGPLATAPPPPVTPGVKPPAPAPAPSAPVPVGGAVQAGRLIFGPHPAYPRIAIVARIQGTVHIQAIIERDGSIGHLQILSGPPVLQSAALEAVKQWRYKPTLLNGQPVEVITEIEVNFALSSQ